MSEPLLNIEFEGAIESGQSAGQPGRQQAQQEVPPPAGREGQQRLQQQVQFEAALLPLWREFLARPGVAPTDNFFECGGNSLLAARLATLLSARLSRSLAPSDILAYPSVRSLAAMLSGASFTLPAQASQERAIRQRNAFARMRPALQTLAQQTPAQQTNDSGLADTSGTSHQR